MHTGSDYLIENYLLEELVVFAETGTLAKTAEQLNVTQPTVTRGMQKLEDDLGIQLFDRQPNRISLTPTGELAVQEAVHLIDANKQFIETVQNFDQNQRFLELGATIPGPLILLNHFSDELPQKLQINDQLLSDKVITNLLTTNEYSLILSNQEIMTDEVESLYVGTENLTVNLNKFMFQGNQRSIKFDEIKGLSFLVLSDIGTWSTIITREIPEAKFLYQHQREAFTEITKYSDFPYFSTNLSRFDPHYTERSQDDDRVNIPLSDHSAHMDIYVSYLKRQKQRVKPLLKQITQLWPQ